MLHDVTESYAGNDAIMLQRRRHVTIVTYVTCVCVCALVDLSLAKQRPMTDEATESDVDSDVDDSLSLDSSPFASPRQLRAQALISSASAVELASMADDDSNG